MTTIPEEAVKAAASAIRRAGDTYTEMAHAALTAALPHLPQGVGVKTVDTTELVKALSRLAGNRQSDGVSSLVSVDDRSAIIDGCHALMVALKLQPSAATCPCTLIQQDETCPVGYPSSLCEICDGKGVPQPSSARELALEEGYRQGIEAAAKLIECGCKSLLHGKGECQFPGNCSLEDAAAIRSLISTGGDDE